MIGFGVTEQEPRRPVDQSHKSTTDIQSLLTATGEPKQDGPLIDFHDQIKKDLPQVSGIEGNTTKGSTSLLDD